MTDDNDERVAALNLSADEFRALGHALVDQLGDFFESISERAVTPAHTPKEIRALLGGDGLPQRGTPADGLLRETAELLFDHSLHIGHPRFLGYITSSAAPLGALGDLLASSVNSNVGGWDLAPMASEIEAQTIQWLAELIHYPSGCGGLMVSGGNMANIIGFLAGRRAKASWDIRARGLYEDPRRLTVYASRETHTWLQKTTDVSGLGTDSLRWIATDNQQRMDLSDLRKKIDADRAADCVPFLVVGTAGTVSTGAVDPLQDIAELCTEQDLWVHVDGAYGALGAALPEASTDLLGLAKADSLALDPHKWLYSPLEAGCVLVKSPEHLTDAFSYSPEYYHFVEDDEDPKTNFYEYGIQNSRGFRALKVWLGLRSVGREGYLQMIEDDIELAKRLYGAAERHAELEARTQQLSITTFRYKPEDLDSSDAAVEDYLNDLNEELLTRLNNSGDAFLSNAVLDGRNLLRACVVNFRTSARDIDAIPGIVVRLGADVDRELRPAELRP